MQTTDARTCTPARAATLDPSRRRRRTRRRSYSRVLSAIVAFGPPVLLLFVIFRGVGGPVRWWTIALAALFVVVIGHAVTIGFHRLFTHRSFVANRPLKVVAGGARLDVVPGLVDRVGRRPSPSSPVLGPSGRSPFADWIGDRTRSTGGAASGTRTSDGASATSRRRVSSTRPTSSPIPTSCSSTSCSSRAAWPTLALPFAIGYLWTGTLAGAVGVALLAPGHPDRDHATTSPGRSTRSAIASARGRSGRTTRARNVRALAVFTMGESWHNTHHAFPRRHATASSRDQVDSSAAMIRVFERLGWVTNVQWPDPAKVAARRVAQPQTA